MNSHVYCTTVVPANIYSIYMCVCMCVALCTNVNVLLLLPVLVIIVDLQYSRAARCDWLTTVDQVSMFSIRFGTTDIQINQQ